MQDITKALIVHLMRTMGKGRHSENDSKRLKSTG